MDLGKIKDYAILREWCMTIYDYLLSIHPEMADSLKEIIKTVEEEIDQKSDIKRMRMLYKEMNWLVGDGFLTDTQMDSLNWLLLKKFKYNMNDVTKSNIDEIDKIIKRGKICNDREFELVRNREDAIYADDSQWDYAESLRKLMSDYEDLKSEKFRKSNHN